MSENPVPEIIDDGYKVYVKVDTAHRITQVNSSAFIPTDDLPNWIEIDQGHGDKYHHAQGNYFDTPLYDDYGIPTKKLIEGIVTDRTEEEIQLDISLIPPPPPTTDELLRALLTGGI